MRLLGRQRRALCECVLSATGQLFQVGHLAQEGQLLRVHLLGSAVVSAASNGRFRSDRFVDRSIESIESDRYERRLVLVVDRFERQIAIDRLHSQSVDYETAAEQLCARRERLERSSIGVRLDRLVVVVGRFERRQTAIDRLGRTVRERHPEEFSAGRLQPGPEDVLGRTVAVVHLRTVSTERQFGSPERADAVERASIARTTSERSTSARKCLRQHFRSRSHFGRRRSVARSIGQFASVGRSIDCQFDHFFSHTDSVALPHTSIATTSSVGHDSQ
jgi:hypothetical protein